jgi:F0F1-type ATP synthase membrane subunit c/vacuolar-type H+-ATPase subunit K
MENRRYQLASRLRLAGRIIGLGMTGFGGAMLIGEAVSEFLNGDFVRPELAGVLLVVIGLVALVGLILSWRNERLAGIMLVAVSVAIGAHIAVYAARNHALAWAMVGLPYLVSGVLFLNAWRLSREAIIIAEEGGGD